jgi:ATP-binding cassette subfamily B protein
MSAIKSLTEKDKINIGFSQFFGIVKWVICFSFRLAPLEAGASCIFGTIANLDQIINPFIFAKILDSAIKIVGKTESLSGIFLWLIIYFLYNLLISLIRYLRNFYRNNFSIIGGWKVDQKLYEKVNTLGIQIQENPEFANSLQRAKEITGNISNFMQRIFEFLAMLITLIISALIVFKTTPLVILLIIIFNIPNYLIDRKYMGKIWGYHRDTTEERRSARTSSGILLDSSKLHEINISQAFGYLDKHFKKYADKTLKFYREVYKKWFSWSYLQDNLSDIIIFIGYVLIFKNLLKGLISIGTTTFQIRNLNVFSDNLENIGGQFSSIYEDSLRFDDLKKIFETTQPFPDGRIEYPYSEKPPLINFNAVSFKYPGSKTEVIKSLNLEIKPAEKIAIVGENGAGKTTLVKLLCRFYLVNKGIVSLNKENINNLKIESWYKNLGVLFQDFNVYPNFDVKENIFLGKADEKFDINQIIKATQSANAYEFIKKYPKGYEQILSEKYAGGIRPSTGQWQKIAIAKFFYRNSPVVVFDEPTASIDAISEAKIFEEIYNFFRNKTVIIISHRFSTVRNADKIYVLDNGQIIESGAHKELLKLKGKYAEAFKIQAKGYE